MREFVLANLDFIELILYIFYIYFLVILGIILKPTVYTIVPLVIYVYYTTWNIMAMCKLDYMSLVLKLMIITYYAFICSLAYIITHTIYWKYPKFIGLLFFSPFVYYVALKVCCYVMKCNPYVNFIYAIKVIRFFSNIFINTNNIL